MPLSTVQINTQEDPDCAVIWLHGLGANGHDFEPIVTELNLPVSVRARFIFPHAPVQAVSLYNGAQMPAWYDIYGLEINSKEDNEGIKNISVEINTLIQQQIDAGIFVNKIVLAGFSQGGALALYAGLNYPQQLGGLLALSCYLPLREQIESFAKPTGRDLPIFIAHGTYDDVVLFTSARLAKKLLEKQGFKIDWHGYPCAHTVCAEEIQDIREFLLNCWQ